MSYDISLIDPKTKEVIEFEEKHHIATYAMGSQRHAQMAFGEVIECKVNTPYGTIPT